MIHNIAHQGRGPMAELAPMEVPPHYAELFRLYDPIGGEHMNIFKAGLACATRIVAVSHGCASACGHSRVGTCDTSELPLPMSLELFWLYNPIAREQMMMLGASLSLEGHASHLSRTGEPAVGKPQDCIASSAEKLSSRELDGTSSLAHSSHSQAARLAG